MFIETSRPRELGDRARLVSPLYNASAKFYCVSFFYHMYGKHIGESGDQVVCPCVFGGREEKGGSQEVRDQLRGCMNGVPARCQVTSWVLCICSLLIPHNRQVRGMLPYKSERLSIFPRPHSNPCLTDSLKTLNKGWKGAAL